MCSSTDSDLNEADDVRIRVTDNNRGEWLVILVAYAGSRAVRKIELSFGRGRQGLLAAREYAAWVKEFVDNGGSISLLFGEGE